MNCPQHCPFCVMTRWDLSPLDRRKTTTLSSWAPSQLLHFGPLMEPPSPRRPSKTPQIESTCAALLYFCWGDIHPPPRLALGTGDGGGGGSFIELALFFRDCRVPSLFWCVPLSREAHREEAEPQEPGSGEGARIGQVASFIGDPQGARLVYAKGALGFSL